MHALPQEPRPVRQDVLAFFLCLRNYVSDAHDTNRQFRFDWCMANPWGTTLSRTIRHRAYSSAELIRKAKEVESLEAALAAAKNDLKAIEEGLAELDRTIAEQSVIDVAAIRPINRVPKSGLFKQGDLAAAIIQVLRSSQEPVTTPVIVALVARKLGLPIDSSEDWATTRLRVKKQLQTYAKRGAVERTHDLNSTAIGSWRWVGL